MDSVLNFLADYYYIFIIISGLLLFALIGFIVMGKKKAKQEREGVDPTQAPVQTEVNANVGVPSETPAPAVTPEMQPTTVVQNTAPVTPQVTPDPTQNLTMQDAQMMMPPEEEVKNDEPTLIINDPSATPTVEPTPVAPSPASPVASVIPEAPAAPVDNNTTVQ